MFGLDIPYADAVMTRAAQLLRAAGADPDTLTDDDVAGAIAQAADEHGAAIGREMDFLGRFLAGDDLDGA